MIKDAAIILLRHGRSTGNDGDLMQGQGDYPLSEAGVQQVKLAKDSILSWGVPVIASSDLSRAADTAYLLGAPRDVLLDPRLRERDAGSYTGAYRTNMERDLGRSLSDGWRPKEFESLDAVVKRLKAAVEDLLRSGVRGIVVTHGAGMRALDQALGGSDKKFANLGALLLDSRGGRIGRKTLK